MKHNLLVVWPNRPRQMRHLEDTYLLHRFDQAPDKGAYLAEHGGKIEAAVTNGSWGGMTRAMLGQMPNLQIVASSGVGYDSIDVAACTERGVKVTNTPDVLTDDVADLAIGLMIGARRGIVAGDRHVRTGAWGHEGPMRLMQTTSRKRLGIFGFGRIGQAIARRAEAMGMEIAYTGRKPRPESPHRFEQDLVALAAWCDVLVIAVPGGADTRGRVDADVIRAVGPSGTLVNIARGSVVDEPALIAALQDGKLGSAGLDVFHNEPRIAPAFAAMDNVVLSPHAGSATEETRDAMAQLVVDNLAAHFAGAPLLTPVN